MTAETDYLREWFPDDDADDFSIKLRIQSRWDEAHFQRMIEAADAFLSELATQQVHGERWHFAFGEYLAMLIGLMQHPGFLAANELSLTNEQYRIFIEERVSALRSLADRYALLRPH